MKALEEDPFMFLEKGGKSEVTEIFTKNHLNPEIKFTTWDDYAIMSMIEQGMGVSILTELVLRKTNYDVVPLPIDPPIIRTLAVVTKERRTLPLAAKVFIEQLMAQREQLL